MKASIDLFSGKLSVNLIFIPVLVGMCVLVGVEAVMAFLMALVVHEFAHCAVASALGIKVYALKFMPYGCEADTEELYVYGAKNIAVAAAGPAANIICAAVLTFAIKYGNTSSFLFGLVQTNMVLAGINLLPAMPLDGGRIFLEMLSVAMPRSRAARLTQAFGVIASLSILSFAVYMLFQGEGNPTAFLMGIFMFASAVKTRETQTYSAVRSASLKREYLNRKKIVESKAIAVKKGTSSMEVLRAIDNGKYNMIYIFDEDMDICGMITERDFMREMVRHGTQVEIQVIAKMIDQKRQ